MIALYVDDLLIACNNSTKLSEIKAALSRALWVKDLTKARQCLGSEAWHIDRPSVVVVETIYWDNLDTIGNGRSKGHSYAYANRHWSKLSWLDCCRCSVSWSHRLSGMWWIALIRTPDSLLVVWPSLSRIPQGYTVKPWNEWCIIFWAHRTMAFTISPMKTLSCQDRSTRILLVSFPVENWRADTHFWWLELRCQDVPDCKNC